MSNKGPVRFDQINRITETRYRLLDAAQAVTEEGETVLTLMDGSDVPQDQGRFLTECEEHGTVAGWKNLHQARMAMAMPIWCGTRRSLCEKVVREAGVTDVQEAPQTTNEREEAAA